METTREKKVNVDISVRDTIDRKAIKLKKTVKLSSSAKDVNKMVNSLEKGVIILRNKVDSIVQQKQSQNEVLEKNVSKEKVKICASASSIPNKNIDKERSL